MAETDSIVMNITPQQLRPQTTVGLRSFPRRDRSSFSVFRGRASGLLAALHATILLSGVPTPSLAQPTRTPSPSIRRFRVLALAESGGHHIAFTEAAKPWLKKCGEDNGFEVDYITNTAPITEALLARYQVVLQLDF